MSAGPANAHRGTIFLDDNADILEQTAFEGGQYILRVNAPRCAAAAVPGSFAHISCADLLPMRRPLSIMRANAAQGWIDILYKTHGVGLSRLAERTPRETLSVLGPIGNGFKPHPDRPKALLIGGGVGIPPLVFLAEQLSTQAPKTHQAIAFFGSELPFPFRTRPSKLLVPGMPDGVIACVPLLEDWGVACRLASFGQFPGCFSGYVTDLAAHFLQTLEDSARAQVEIFACGPTVMLNAVARLARRFDVAAQVSLEEYMACAVGGCAGCAVAVRTSQGPAMKRVCVDGPVFDALAVFDPD